MKDLTFQPARLDDVPRIAGMLKRLYEKVGDAYGINYHHDSALNTVASLVRNGIVLVGDHSCAGARILRWPFNQTVLVGETVFWAFGRAKEITILESLAEECFKRGAGYITAASHFPENKIGRRYLKLGFKAAETQHLLRLPITSPYRTQPDRTMPHPCRPVHTTPHAGIIE